MEENNCRSTRVILTGFMGVGKSTVARHLSYILKMEAVDLDYFIEVNENTSTSEIIENKGISYFRLIETENLKKILQKNNTNIISLGGGAWTIEENRNLIRESGGTTIWLESTFEHCWRNIAASWRERPLAKNKKKAKKLFEERQLIYCLADWHFIIKPDLTSFDIAKQIAEEVF
jgi:shikimate kinase